LKLIFFVGGNVYLAGIGIALWWIRLTKENPVNIVC